MDKKMTSKYQKYFENIISRSWAGTQNFNTKIDVKKINETAEVEAIYYEGHIEGKDIVIGKTGFCYFIIEYYDHKEDDYSYSKGLFNNELKNLIKFYKDKEKIIGGMTPESFAEKAVLQNKLELMLEPKEKSTVKRLKI